MKRMAVIGTGIFGEHHAKVYKALPDTELVAICDRNEVRLGELADRFDVKGRYTDHRKMFENEELDAVSIATPDATHTSLILDAFDAGLDVLTEKPMTVTLEEADQVIAARDKAGRKLMVDFHNRVNPVVVNAAVDVGSGGIGKPVHVSARLSNTTFVPLEMLSWAADSSALWFLGSHVIDALRFILQDDVQRVYAVSRSGVLKSKGVDTEDVHMAILEFKKGAIASLENSWILSPDNPQVFDFRVEITGDKGQLKLNPSHNDAYVRMQGQGVRHSDLLGVSPTGDSRIGGFVYESIARFVDALVYDAPVLASAEDGRAVTQVLYAIQESVQTGKPVDIK